MTLEEHGGGEAAEGEAQPREQRPGRTGTDLSGEGLGRPGRHRDAQHLKPAVQAPHPDPVGQRSEGEEREAVGAAVGVAAGVARERIVQVEAEPRDGVEEPQGAGQIEVATHEQGVAGDHGRPGPRAGQQGEDHGCQPARPAWRAQDPPHLRSPHTASQMPRKPSQPTDAAMEVASVSGKRRAM